MTNVLNWVRNNPITVAAIVVALVAAGLFGYAYTLNTALQERMQAQRQPLSTLDSLRRQSIPFPNADPTQPEIPVQNIAINQGVIDEFEVIFGRFDRQFEDLYAYAIRRNRDGKQVMLEGLFPSPASADLPFDARSAYRDRVVALLGAAGDDTSGPALDASEPPSSERIANEIADAEESTLDTIVSIRLEAQEGGLTESETQEVFEAKQQRLVDVLQDAASQATVYADTDPFSPDFPFVIQGWALDVDPPTVAEMWEGQMQLWVLEDVVEAIELANERAAEASGLSGVPASVVKRLISLTVEPGYIGLDSGGLAGGSGRDADTPLRMPAPNVQQPPNFVVSPSGRATNGVYLVRYATLQADISINKLPLLIDAIDEVNFMTIVDMDVRRVDEYEMLNENYFYGSDDVAEVTLTIETVWFRDWLAPMMPAVIARSVGQPARDNQGNQGGQRRGNQRGNNRGPR
ncbi:MAG: hypothetical protein AAF586_01105 [Planctomycetota bacterium]